MRGVILRHKLIVQFFVIGLHLYLLLHVVLLLTIFGNGFLLLINLLVFILNEAFQIRHSLYEHCLFLNALHLLMLEVVDLVHVDLVLLRYPVHLLLQLLDHLHVLLPFVVKSLLVLFFVLLVVPLFQFKIRNLLLLFLDF
jgi:hypothetical protein